MIRMLYSYELDLLVSDSIGRANYPNHPILFLLIRYNLFCAPIVMAIVTSIAYNLVVSWYSSIYRLFLQEQIGRRDLKSWRWRLVYYLIGREKY